MLVCIVLIQCLLEIGCLIKTAEALTGQKGRKRVLQFFIMAVMLAVSIYINFYDGNRVFQLLQHVGLFCILKMRYEMSIIDTAIYSVFCYLIVATLEILIYVPYNLLYSLCGGVEENSVVVIFLIFILCCFMEKKKIIVANQKWIDYYKEKINLRFIIVLFALLFIFLLGFSKFGAGMSLEEGIYLSLALFMFLTLVYKLSGYQMEIDYHKRYADKYGEVITELRERQHKFMNQLDSVYALCKIYDNYDELVQHQETELNHLRKYLMPGKLLILERPLVVAHIYTKLCEAEEQGITIHTDFSCSLEYIDIPDIFLIEIVGNLLDNAMDEVLSREKSEKIKIAITDDGNEICLSVGNEHDKIPYQEYSKFFENGYSSKGSRRGVGLPYVKKIVKKFHGHIQIGNVIYGTDNYFVVSVYFKR